MIYTDELEPLAGGAEDALPGGLWDAVLHLPEEQRAAVTLYYYEDLPVAEIARVLGVAQGTVKSRLCLLYTSTTGKADMTLLEKLLYIADYMEPTRDFPGVERLRALAYEDLDAAVLLGCEMSIQEMAERGLPVHPNTVKARDWLRSKTKGTSD